MQEPIGTIGILCPQEAPLLGFISTVMPAIAVGNTVVAIPSELFPLITADLYQLFESSDLPAGTVNIVTGRPAELLKTLAEHDDVDALWVFADAATCSTAKALSIGNLKQVFTNEGRANRLVQPRPLLRPLLPPTRHPNQKHLGPLRRIRVPRLDLVSPSF